MSCLSPQLGQAATTFVVGLLPSVSPTALILTPHLQSQVATVVIIAPCIVRVTAGVRCQEFVIFVS